MIENAALLRSAANQIDELDEQIRALNEDKKAIYQNAKETVTPADYKAWRNAVKLRQKRRVDRDQMEADEARTHDMLMMLEASGTAIATRAHPHDARENTTTELRSRPADASGKSAGADEIAVPSAPVLTHDPETGEIVETPDERLSSSGQDGEAVPPNPAALTPETGGGACPGPASEPYADGGVIYSAASNDDSREIVMPEISISDIDNPLPDFLRRTKAVA